MFCILANLQTLFLSITYQCQTDSSWLARRCQGARGENHVNIKTKPLYASDDGRFDFSSYMPQKLHTGEYTVL